MYCQVCHQRPVYPNSIWCGNGCRFSGKPGSANHQITPITQGQPLCQICNNPAFYDSSIKSFAPGCCRSHSQQAISRGHTKPR